VEDKANYSVAVVYHPDLDPRKEVTIRINATDRSSIIPNIRVEEDHAMIVGMLIYAGCSKPSMDSNFRTPTGAISNQPVVGIQGNR
jgi:hypothetical protein